MKAPNKKQVSKIQKQKAALRASLWPGLDEKRLWFWRETGGWLNIPRAMPLLLRIMDNMSKGKPVSQTYLDLWCRTYNDSFVIASKQTEMAFYAGFNGERAVRTWLDRILILKELGFIEIQPGPNGPISYILILNPFHVLKDHQAKGHIDQKSYNALIERLIETGTDELAEPEDGEKEEEKEAVLVLESKPATNVFANLFAAMKSPSGTTPANAASEAGAASGTTQEPASPSATSA